MQRCRTTSIDSARWLPVAVAAIFLVACTQSTGSDENVGATSLTVLSGEEVVLDGSGLFGGAGSTSYRWEQLGGPSVPIPDESAATLRFVAPHVDVATFIVISLTASQPELSATTLYTVTVLPVGGSEPRADGGPADGEDGSTSTPTDAGAPEADAGMPSTPPMTLAFNAVADTYVDEWDSSSTFGSEARLKTDQDSDERTYVQFDLSGITAPVTRATLRLLVFNGSSDGPSVHETETTWSESALTWDNQPGPSGPALHDPTAVPDDAWMEYDVTAGVSGNGEVAFVLLPTSSDGCDFRSREGGSAPQLVVDFGGSDDGTSGGGCSDASCDATPPEVTLTSPSDGETITGTVTLTADAFDDVGVTQVDFRWDSESFGAPDTAAPYAFTWDTTAFDDGFYTLTAVARDAAGHETISNLVSVSVANHGDTDPAPPPPPPDGSIVRVPEDYGSVQQAIDAAQHGDTVLIADGTYTGGVRIAGKALTLASHYVLDGDRGHVGATTLNGGSPIVEVAGSAAGTRVVGLTFTGGREGVQAFGEVEVRDNRFIGVDSDAASLERTGGVIRGNYFDGSGDDAIDADGPDDSLIENNVLLNSDDDGIEIRNYDYSGTLRTITIRNNRIDTSGEDGIQIIDYPATSDRRFVIEKNLITHSVDVGLGLMDSGETVEDYRAASMPERIHVIGNTFADNTYGITGGDNLVAINNVIVGCSAVGMKRTDGSSEAAHNLFHGNGTDHEGSHVDAATTLYSDPRLTSDYGLGSGSPAIDAGTTTFVFRGETVLDLSSSQYTGAAPDLGYEER